MKNELKNKKNECWTFLPGCPEQMGERSTSVCLQSILFCQTGGQHSAFLAASPHSATGGGVSSSIGSGTGAGTSGGLRPVPQTLSAVWWQIVTPYPTSCCLAGQLWMCEACMKLYFGILVFCFAIHIAILQIVSVKSINLKWDNYMYSWIVIFNYTLEKVS